MSLGSYSNHYIHFAPMVGLSHWAVRDAIAQYLPAGARVLWPTEMLSSRRLVAQSIHQTPEVYFFDVDRGLCPQVLGNDQDDIRSAIQNLEQWGAVAIDINMGCPVQKALKHNYGVSLMGDADYAARVVEMAVKASQLPVSVKLRSGLQKDNDFLLRFARGLQNAGAGWLTLHPRTADQKRRGSADWLQISWLKENLQIPVIGNGDLQTVEDIERCRAMSGCDRVMVGRALLARPWLLRELGSSPQDRLGPEGEGREYGVFLESVLDRLEARYEASVGLRKWRFLMYHSSVWLEFGHTLYAVMSRATSYEGVRTEIKKFFAEPKRMFQRTELRH